MVIVALLIGLVAGAAGVYAVALRRALADRDRANLEARDAQRLLAETEGALASERGAFDVRVENAIKALSTEALRENANAFTEQAIGRLGVFVEPLQKSLDKVEINVNLLEQQRQRAYGEIHKELELVASQQRGPEHANGQSRQRSEGGLADTRPMGRDPAASRDRDGGDAPALRLRGATVYSRRRRRHPATRRDREAPGTGSRS